MVQNNKVLTVSYGTFSCTLEGFEDSFGTMKAIAEYFRDLAADDRYFGAEPPQPDAEMLARIAQREIARQVEARSSDEGIHLRAATAAVPVEKVEAPSLETATPEQDTARFAEVGGEVETASAPEDLTPDLEDDSVELWEEEDTTATQIDSIIDEDVDDQSSESEVTIQDTTAEDFVAEENPDEIEDVSAQAPKTVPAADSIAAKLQRIRAVVANTAEEDEFSEDEHADDILDVSVSELSNVLEAGETELDFQSDEIPDESDDEIARVLDRLDLGAALPEADDDTSQLADDVAVADDLDDGVDDDFEDEAQLKPLRRRKSSRRQPVEDALPEEDDGAQVEEEEVEEATSEQPKPLRARIARIKRADLDSAVQSGRLADLSTVSTASDAETSSLSDEDEADLMRELAEVEAELLAATDGGDDEVLAHGEAGEGDDADNVFQEVEQASERPASKSPDSDVSRLMAKADAKLGDPENSTSRETYSQLRAAVAAAEAEKSVGGSMDTDNEAEAYRQDLASVVQPRRPRPTKGETPRPRNTAQRPAPLKLVAEQRIDPTPTAVTPVRPRRISTVTEDTSTNTEEAKSGFATYLQERGAVELQDMLEAAAAYISFVEGQDNFSRPQLMNKVRNIGTGQFNREDGLRSFGQLLRDGKIEKSQNGRFIATDDIGFQPSERATG